MCNPMFAKIVQKIKNEIKRELLSRFQRFIHQIEAKDLLFSWYNLILFWKIFQVCHCYSWNLERSYALSIFKKLLVV